ncbi:EF-hand calcium-binding domain-containing protein 1-like [Drosophila hydei]|uniref:EF-hand calcium-binding domain-containing protein 1-like n=1 Tax=Drosophila hydei TaxID=7224 RepID=A0A6J1MBC3_DROHY|nr:EF-hand calcium-binding domain-containing protein 1-like [Drosophila hydei]
MKDLDLTLDYMENARFNYIYAGALANIESPFTHTEVLCLTMVYHKFVLMNGPKAKYMSLGQVGTILMKMFLLSDIEINRRVVTFVSFNQECADPKFSPDRHCTLPSFVKLFHIYFSNDLEERMLFVFNVYDGDHLGYLNREHVMRFIEKFFVGEDEDEQIEMRMDMLELIFMKFDLDKDLVITFEEYAEVIRQQPELLEFLGVVFPSKVQLNTVALCVNLL